MIYIFIYTRSSSRYAALLLGPCGAGTLASRAGGLRPPWVAFGHMGAPCGRIGAFSSYPVQISQIRDRKSTLSQPFPITNLGNLDRIRHDHGLADGWITGGRRPPIGAEGSPAPAGRCHVAEGHPWGPKAPSSRSERARPAGA